MWIGFFAVLCLWLTSDFFLLLFFFSVRVPRIMLRVLRPWPYFSISYHTNHNNLPLQLINQRKNEEQAFQKNWEHQFSHSDVIIGHIVNSLFNHLPIIVVNGASRIDFLFWIPESPRHTCFAALWIVPTRFFVTCHSLINQYCRICCLSNF